MAPSPDDAAVPRDGQSWQHVLKAWAASGDGADPLHWVWTLGNAVIEQHPAAVWQVINGERPELVVGEVSLDLVTVLERGEHDPEAGIRLVRHFVDGGWGAR